MVRRGGKVVVKGKVEREEGGWRGGGGWKKGEVVIGKVRWLEREGGWNREVVKKGGDG